MLVLAASAFSGPAPGAHRERDRMLRDWPALRLRRRQFAFENDAMPGGWLFARMGLVELSSPRIPPARKESGKE
jgi:hypothetical protein